MTLIFNKLLELVKWWVPAKFRQAKCSGSWLSYPVERARSWKQCCRRSEGSKL